LLCFLAAPSHPARERFFFDRVGIGFVVSRAGVVGGSCRPWLPVRHQLASDEHQPGAKLFVVHFRNPFGWFALDISANPRERFSCKKNDSKVCRLTLLSFADLFRPLSSDNGGMRKYIRRNRRSGEIAEDEQRVLFRMSARDYQALKQVAKGKKKPVTVIINEALEKQYKLSSIAKPFPAISTRKSQK